LKVIATKINESFKLFAKLFKLCHENRMTLGYKLEFFIKDAGLSDSKLGQMLVPPVTGACVWGWRHGRSEPERLYRGQLIKISNGYICADDFI
jgi:hypothetical protein